MRPAEPGRNALLAAGRAVLRQRGLAGLTVNAVVAEAGMAKGSFYTHFADRTAFLTAVQYSFHEQMTQAVLAAVAGRAPGPARFACAMTAYFDTCHEYPEAIALLGEAQFAPTLASLYQLPPTPLRDVVVEDLTAIGWQHPEDTALMLTFTASDVVLRERETGSPRPEMRTVFFALATGATRPAVQAGAAVDPAELLPPA